MKEPGHRLRWKLCKALGKSVDDTEFAQISREQWFWYSAMIIQDEQEDYEHQRNLLEYLASFWNSSAVKKIQDARSSSEVHNFASDEEFEQQILGGDYRDNKFIKAIQSINDMKDTNSSSKGDDDDDDSMRNLIMKGKIKLPTDLATLIDEV